MSETTTPDGYGEGPSFLAFLVAPEHVYITPDTDGVMLWCGYCCSPMVDRPFAASIKTVMGYAEDHRDNLCPNPNGPNIDTWAPPKKILTTRTDLGGPALAAHATEMDALRQRHHREIGAHLAGHDHADDCAACSIRGDDREVIAQLREELEALKDAGADLDRQALLETIAAGDDERDALRKKLEEARRVGAATKADLAHSQANCRAAIEHRQASDDQTARLTADLAAARAELDEATEGGVPWIFEQHGELYVNQDHPAIATLRGVLDADDAEGDYSGSVLAAWQDALTIVFADQERLASGETCVPGMPMSCGDAHTAGHCARPAPAAGDTAGQDDYAAKIAEWHDAPEGSDIAAKPLHEHLGMTWEQYQQWAGPRTQAGQDAAGGERDE